MTREPNRAGDENRTGALSLGKGAQVNSYKLQRCLTAGQQAIRTRVYEHERQRPRDIRGIKYQC